ncbi:hypothetical protein B0H10DRAFT_2239674 [Mycena sp. CBHHK59/15]|nr:hypothetical protein B0H10DRAFT_2239674 [Mycena sp. CBHHK59/15]
MLWDMCPPERTFGHVPCGLGHWRDDRPEVDLTLRTWACVPDARLPALWSCDWAAFRDTYYWCPAEDAERPHDLLLENWRHLGLEPALFRACDPGYRTEVVLCTPGGTGMHFLWGHEMGHDRLRCFEGEYTGVEDFIENADWNRMALLPHLPCLW